MVGTMVMEPAPDYEALLRDLAVEGQLVHLEHIAARPARTAPLSHPLPRLLDAGVQVTLGSDDPPYFGATIGAEYALCAEHYGLDDEALKGITLTAIDAAFCEETLKRRLMQTV